ncbi:hypothetical protein [Garciella nitratireducens]|uniref:Uncharacterized protein n=1 Tax=Garciella nitratireducens DSM 15102 TaxID=1121911 RepID=A0A1T4K5U7_9FIRM|nr:hypothetical protein [Garciella nitratireducens]SJZ37713.1 hypothetical protein SAMN02745973_00358 [Garciella nitratireducens DSM 15102]
MKEWTVEYCTEKPLEFDFESSPGHVIERRNIVEKNVVDEETGESRIEYECEMRFLTVKEYTENIRMLQDTVDTLVLSNLEG